MAIIQPRSEFTRVEDFLNGIRKASEGTLLIEGRMDKGVSQCTAWLITDSLAVMPDYMDGVTFQCRFSSDPDRIISANRITKQQDQRSRIRPALLRLSKPLAERAQILQERESAAGDQVFILQHPAGEPIASISFGRILKIEESWLSYDANTKGGSGGAPIIDSSGRVVGMHIKFAAQNSNGETNFNQGLSLAAILGELRDTEAWDEIARYHRLANITASQSSEASTIVSAPSEFDEDIAMAAVSWSFAPESLTLESRDRLRPLVVEESAKQWILRPEERQRVFQARSLQDLRVVRGSESAKSSGQRVIDTILLGPPYRLEDVHEEDLPYWLQAVRWFKDLVPELPQPGQVNRELERRRVRSRLRQIAGPRFRGRARELADLSSWFHSDHPGPKVVTGIGGMGKSALIASFAKTLANDTALLWLDFDRADLAPDDPVSVLSSLYEQATLQLDGFSTPTEKSWPEAAEAFGQELSRLASSVSPPLLVLDGFEVAQHSKLYAEIWRVLEQVQIRAPQLRVLVVGRAPVSVFQLGGRTSSSLTLSGISREDATEWLQELGVNDPRVLDRVLEISNCVPLALKLAVRWIEEGGKVDELPEALPRKLVEGVLYRRVLDRVIDPELRDLARDALVLRRLTAEMMLTVLADRLPEEVDADELFARLSKEMAIVAPDEDRGLAAASDGTVLRVRPEVREATLRLLEMDSPERVQAIDRRAIDWYEKQDPEQVTHSAEIVYHRLRLGDISGAAQAWRDGCASRLLYAEGELPESQTAARAWLRKQIEQSQTRTISVGEWELDAVADIRKALKRGLTFRIPEVLSGRPERSHDSPLVIFDAWSRWQAGDRTAARRLLAEHPSNNGPVARDRAILAALLAIRDGDTPHADRLLKSFQSPDHWSDRGDSSLYSLAVRAARIRLTVDLRAELHLAEQPGFPLIERSLSPMEVTIPYLIRQLADDNDGLESVKGSLEISIPQAGVVSEPFSSLLQIVWTKSAPRGEINSSLEDPHPPVPGRRFLNVPRSLRAACEQIAMLAWQRWRFVIEDNFLSDACELTTLPSADLLALSIITTLGVFASDGPFSLIFKSQYLSLSIARSVKHANVNYPLPPSNRIELALRLLETGRDFIAGQEYLALEQLLKGRRGVLMSRNMFASEPTRDSILYVLGYLLGPDPLEMLLRHVLGLPETFAFQD